MTAIYRPDPATLTGDAQLRASIPHFKLMPDETVDIPHIAAVFWIDRSTPDRHNGADL